MVWQGMTSILILGTSTILVLSSFQVYERAQVFLTKELRDEFHARRCASSAAAIANLEVAKNQLQKSEPDLKPNFENRFLYLKNELQQIYANQNCNGENFRLHHQGQNKNTPNEIFILTRKEHR